MLTLDLPEAPHCHTYHTTGTTWYGMVGIATLPHYHTTPEEGRPPATFSLLSPVGTSDPSSLLTFSPAIHLSSAKTSRRIICYLGLFFLKSLSNFQANIIFIFCHTYVAYRKRSVHMSSTLDARRTNLGMFKNHNEKLNFRKNESDSRYITFRLVYNGINQSAANIENIN